MIKLSENRTALLNLGVTIAEIEKLVNLIEIYSLEIPGPAYCTFETHTSSGVVDVQLSRKIIVPALEAQLQQLVDYMATVGIEV